MLINIKCKKEKIMTACSYDNYYACLIRLNKDYPGNVWIVRTNNNRKFEIDLRDKRHRSITY